MIYLNDDLGSFDLEAAVRGLPAFRREKAMQLRFEADRRQSVAAYILLKRGMEKEFGISEIPDFAYDGGGKPFLPGLPRVHFNLSHCREAAVCAISRSPVGIDVERIVPYDDDLMLHVLNDREYRQVKGSPDPEVEFLRLWTVKESFLKLTGTGLTDNLKELSAEYDRMAVEGKIAFTTEIDKRRRYIYTLCSTL